MKRVNFSMILFLCFMIVISALSCSSGTKKNSDGKFEEKIQKGIDYSVFWKGEKSYPYKVETLTIKEVFPFDGRDKEINYYLEIEYPKIVGMPDNVIQDSINQLIEEFVTVEIVGEPNCTGYEFDAFMFVNYKVTLLTDNYLSILFDGTHQYGKTNRIPMVLNVDLLTGEKLEIEDFFLLTVDAAKLVMEYCKNDLENQYEEYYVEEISEQFSMLIDWGCTKKTCSLVSLTNDGFYLIFDDLFSRAEGRWVVHAPYSAFGDNCLLNEFKDVYGFFSLPFGWSYIYNERNLRSNYIFKFPAIKDENGYVVNARMLNDTDVLIELPLELPDKLRSGEKNPYINSYVLIQRNLVHYDSSLDGIGSEISAPFAPTQSSQLESELSSHLKSETCMIDGHKYTSNNDSNPQRVFTKNPAERKITKKWGFQSLKHDINITFYIDYEYYSDLLRLNDQDSLKDMEIKINYQINEIFRTFSHTS